MGNTASNTDVTTSSTTNNNNGGGCPVIHTNPSKTIMVEESVHRTDNVGSASGCPVKHNSTPGDKLPPITIRVDPRNMMPITPENYNKRKQHNATKNAHIHLSKTRQVSSIPKSDFTPKHQEKDKGGQAKTWVYPSEQMFYNAMERKGWDPNAEDMKSVVQIHNAVNERTWMELLKWEKMRDVENDSNNSMQRNPPRLVKFQGRPTDLSPKAMFKMYVLGYTKPFDRHDWYVDRGNGSEPIRYIIDFYSGNVDTTTTTTSSSTSEDTGGNSNNNNINNPMMKPSNERIGFHLDVRPSLDSYESIKCRLKGLFM